MSFEIVPPTRNTEPWIVLTYPPVSAIRRNRRQIVEVCLAGMAESIAKVNRPAPERVLEFRPYDYLKARLDMDVDRIPRTVFVEDRPNELRETRREVFAARRDKFNKNIRQVIVDDRAPIEALTDPLEIHGQTGYDLILATPINDLGDPNALIRASYRALNDGGLLVYICEDQPRDPIHSPVRLYNLAKSVFITDPLHSALFERVVFVENQPKTVPYGCFWFGKK